MSFEENNWMDLGKRLRNSDTFVKPFMLKVFVRNLRGSETVLTKFLLVYCLAVRNSSEFSN